MGGEGGWTQDSGLRTQVEEVFSQCESEGKEGSARKDRLSKTKAKVKGKGATLDQTRSIQSARNDASRKAHKVCNLIRPSLLNNTALCNM